MIVIPWKIKCIITGLFFCKRKNLPQNDFPQFRKNNKNNQHISIRFLRVFFPRLLCALDEGKKHSTKRVLIDFNFLNWILGCFCMKINWKMSYVIVIQMTLRFGNRFNFMREEKTFFLWNAKNMRKPICNAQ